MRLRPSFLRRCRGTIPAVILAAITHQAQAATVTNTNDTGAGSLRFAILFATTGETIDFSPSLNGGVITLTSGQLNANSASSNNLTIDASALTDGITISGNQASRVLFAGITLTLNNLSIVDGASTEAGGGVRSLGNLTMIDCTVASCSSGNRGGGINTSGVLTLINSTVSNNTSVGIGGGISTDFPAVTLTNSTVSGNISQNDGGGIFAFGPINLDSCTISGNTGKIGAGIYGQNITLQIKNTIVAGNIATSFSSDLRLIIGTTTSLGGNLIGDNTLVSTQFPAGNPNLNNDIVGTSNAKVDPVLSPLGNYGGKTQTMRPRPTSPAIDAGATTSLINDQRGFPRVVAGTADIGAVEVGATVTVTNTNDTGAGSLRNAISTSAGDTSIIFAAGLSGGEISLTSGVILIDRPLSIDASALDDGMTITATGAFGSFSIASGTLVEMDSLSITDGNAAAGAAILNRGTLTINNSTISDTGGNAIYNLDGDLTLNNSTLTGNSTANNGGAILNNNATLVLNHCTVSGNSAALAGGGIYRISGSVTLNNSIVAGNTAASAPNIFGAFSGSNNLTTGDPRLSPLADNGGATRTMQPLGGSPAIDGAGASPITVDQRGASRLIGAAKDIGAVEVTTTEVTPVAGSTLADVRPTLRWTAPGASFPKMFLGTDPDNLPLQGTAFFPYNINTALSPGTTYYWRIDSTYSGEVIKGAIYSFNTRPKNLVVDTLDDEDDGITTNGISLRDALFEAVESTPPEIISFHPSLNGQTITLGATPLAAFAKSLTIDASSLPDGITIDADGSTNAKRVFWIGFSNSRDHDVLMDSLTLTGGNTTQSGGGILNYANLTLVDCTIHDCVTTSNGGAISNLSNLSLIRSTIHDNSAGASGGGIVNSGSLTVTNSTLTGNDTSNGGGGGIFNFNTLVLSSATITGNSSNFGGGGIQTQSGTAEFKNSIIAANTASSDFNVGVSSTIITTLGGNLIGSESRFTNQFPVGNPNINGDIVGSNFNQIDPALAPLAANGGRTLTMSLLPGSPAADAAVATTLLTDQRGFARILGSAPDIGAYESAASDYSLSGLVLNATIDPGLTSAGVRFEISIDPLFRPNVTTLAGTGSPALTDGPTSGAAFNNASGVTQDSAGNLFIADTGNNAIRRISPSGEVTTIAGTGGFGFNNGPGNTATFAIPGSIILGPDNNLYVTDILNHCIRKLTRPATSGLPWTVTTLAGNGVAGFGNATGTAAQFNAPQGLAFDSTGLLYIADSGNHRIRRINLNSRQVETFAGVSASGSANGARTTASFNKPYGLTFDTIGNLYIADRDNHRIRKIGTGGIVSTFAGSSAGALDATGTAAQFHSPIGLTIDPLGNLYVADESNHAIRKVTTPGAVVTTTAGLGTSGLEDGNSSVALFNCPTNLIVDLKGDLIVADARNHSIRRIVVNPIIVPAVVNGGNLTASIDAAALGLEPNTVYFFRWRSLLDQSTQDPASSFFLLDAPGVTTTAASNITRTSANINALIDPQGSATTVTFEYSTDPDLKGALRVGLLPSILNEPAGMAVDELGNVYIANRDRHTILVLTPGGALGVVAGNGSPGFADGNGSSAQFDHPSDIAIDAAGNLYVADEFNHRIRMITPAGDVTTIAGSGIAGFADADLATEGELLFPCGIAVDASGTNVYVADRGNHRIRLITAGALSTLAGGDGPGNGPTQFNNPTGVDVDSSGKVYVADRDNHRIRLISGGNVSTLAGSGTQGFLDGDAANAEFAFPTDVAIDDNDGILVADRDNHRLRRIDGDQVTTIAGSGIAGLLNSPTPNALYPATAAKFSSPIRVAIDQSNGAIFLTENGSNFIRKLERDSPLSIIVPRTLVDDGDTPVGIRLPKGLLAGSNYYFRASARNGRNPTEPLFGEILSFATPTNPQIAIFDGPDLSSAQLSEGDTVDFGSTPRGTAVTRSFTITNLGEWDLNVDSIFAPATGPPFVLTNGGTGIIAQGDSLTFDAVIDPSNGGDFSRVIVIASDDPGQREFEIPVTWVVRNPPTVTTDPADGLDDGSATLNASINPQDTSTTVWFEYSPDQNIDGVEVTTVAESDSPAGLATDREGNIYVADQSNHSIHKITPDGTTTIIAGTGVPGFADSLDGDPQFRYPSGVVVGSDGTLYVADSRNHRIRAISPEGEVTTHSGLGVAGFTDGVGSAAQFSTPVALAIDDNDNLYVADINNRRIRKVHPDGSASTLAGSGEFGIGNGAGNQAQFTRLVGIAVSPDGIVYVTESGLSHIRRIIPDGTVDNFIDAGTGLNEPWGLALDADGNLYVADELDHRIAKVTPGGIVSNYAGTGTEGYLDGLGDVARFSYPDTVAVDASGDIIVGEYSNSAIRRITSTTITVEAAAGLDGSIPISTPLAISELEAGPTYYFRAIATNDGGTTHGNIQSFTATSPPSFTSWQQLYFPADADDPLIAGPGADPSGDGVPNLHKYAFNLDPTVNSIDGLPTRGVNGNDLTLTYTQVLAATDLTYTVEWSTDMSDWKTTGISLDVIGGDFETNQVRASIPIGSSRAKFLRLGVTQTSP